MCVCACVWILQFFVLLLFLSCCLNCTRPVIAISNYKTIQNQPISWLVIVNRCQNNSIFIGIIPLCWHWMSRHESYKRRERKKNSQPTIFRRIRNIFMIIGCRVFANRHVLQFQIFLYSKFRAQAYNERIENGLNHKEPSLILCSVAVNFEIFYVCLEQCSRQMRDDLTYQAVLYWYAWHGH